MKEHDIQREVIAWAWSPKTLATYPWLQYLYAIPNGARLSPAQAGKMKAEGLNSGVPDLCLPVRGSKNRIGLYIEMKTAKGRPSPQQTTWLAALKLAAHRVEIARSAEAAIAILKDHLDSPSAPKGTPPALESARHDRALKILKTRAQRIVTITRNAQSLAPEEKP